MIWDIILWFKHKYKINTCIHDYSVDARSVMLNWQDLKFCLKCWRYKKI